ncbi:RTA1-like protein [Meredithblackwellia eburnea MCA 4105]
MSSQPQGNDNPYHYTPSLAMAVVFIILYAISTLAHTYQTFKCRYKWMAVMVVGGIVELMGWAGRIWSREDMNGGGLGSGFTMQISLLIIAPTFYSAALYMLLGVVISELGPKHSPISPKIFKILFILADFLSLVLQGIGGGLASVASSDTIPDRSGIKRGGNIMLGGIVFQLVVMVVYLAYGLYFVLRSRREVEAAGSKMKLLLLGMTIASICIIIRGVYRTAELGQGFDGGLARNQLTFLLDAVPISIATFVLNIFHPSRLLPQRATPALPTSNESQSTMVGVHEKTSGSILGWRKAAPVASESSV